jgi:polyisoprenoid-binding protein YceI
VAEREPSIHVIIDATTLTPTNFDSESKRRMLRGPEFFNVDRFPTIEFKSMRFRYEGDKLVAIDGNITLVGVSKPVTLTVMKSGCEPASSSKAARCTASTELTVKRFEFGIKGWSGTVSDEVMIAVELVATILGEEKPIPPVPTVAASALPAAAPTPAAIAAAKESK